MEGLADAFDAAVSAAIGEPAAAQAPETTAPTAPIGEAPEVEVEPEVEAEGAEFEADAPEAEAEAEAEASTYGTAEDPFSLDDLPDEYVRATPDGEPISIKRAVENYQKQAVVDARLNEAKQVLERVKAAEGQTAQKLQRYEQGVAATFSDDSKAFQFMLQNHPGTLVDLLDKGYRWLHTQAGGEHATRESLESFKRELKLRQKEQLLEARGRQTAEQQRQEAMRRANAAKIDVVRPALQEAMKTVGFTKTPSPEQLRRIGHALTAIERDAGRPLQPAEVTAEITEWLRRYGDKPAAEPGKPRKPRHRAAPKASKPENLQRNHKGQFTGQTHDDMGMPTADYLLSLASKGRK